MGEPRADRPHMPGYGVRPAGEGTGLLPWSWAAERPARSHDYWVATTWPGRPPHVMPVWGVWRDGALRFSSGLQSRKASYRVEPTWAFGLGQEPADAWGNRLGNG